MSLMSESRCVAAAVDVARHSRGSAGVPIGPNDSLLHHLGEADDGVERRAQLVAHVGEETAILAWLAVGWRQVERAGLRSSRLVAWSSDAWCCAELDDVTRAGASASPHRERERQLDGRRWRANEADAPRSSAITAATADRERIAGGMPGRSGGHRRGASAPAWSAVMRGRSGGRRWRGSSRVGAVERLAAASRAARAKTAHRGRAGDDTDDHQRRRGRKAGSDGRGRRRMDGGHAGTVHWCRIGSAEDRAVSSIGGLRTWRAPREDATAAMHHQTTAMEQRRSVRSSQPERDVRLVIGQHGDETRAPDAGAGDRGGGGQPAPIGRAVMPFDAPVSGAGAAEQAERRVGAEQAQPPRPVSTTSATSCWLRVMQALRASSCAYFSPGPAQVR